MLPERSIPISEPWLRGILPDVDPAIGHLIRSGQQIREDLARALFGLTPGLTPEVRFHARHLAGSTQRLCAYLEGRALTDEEIAAMTEEGVDRHESAEELMGRVDAALQVYERLLRSLGPGEFAGLRYVGRARLPVTAIGLAIHIAEHGQRHVGQAITAAKRHD